MTAEGITKFRLTHSDANLSTAALAHYAVVAAWRRVLFDLGLIGLDPLRYGGVGYGNISQRLPPYPGERGRRRFVITGTGTGGTPDIEPVHLCVVNGYDAKQNQIESCGPRAPSSESLTHGALYDLSSRIKCVIHVHAPVVWSQRHRLRIPSTDPQAAYGTPEMAWEVNRLYRDSALADVGLLAMGGHEDGLVAFGQTLEHTGDVIVRFLARAYEVECGL